MSEKLCTLRTKGGGGGAKQEETVLWTNSNPTDSSGFANQDVTLSDSLTDYDYVKIRYAYAYNDTGSTFESVYSVSEFVKTSAPVTFGFSGCTNVTHRSNSYFYDRRIIYKTATSITFGSCMGYKASTAAAVSNIFNIPLSIIGIKNMGGIRTNEKYDTLPFKSVSGNAIPTFATKGRAKAIWMPYMFQATTAHRSLMATNVNPATGEIDNDSYPWYIDTSNLNNYGQLSGWKFVVTDSSVTLSASPSTSNLYVGLVYTY